MILECLHSRNYFQRTILRQQEASKFTYELALLSLSSSLFSRQLCYINTICHFLSTTFLLFQKTFFSLRSSPESYFGLWLSFLFFVGFCRLTTLLSYQSLSFFATPFFTFFYFWYFRYFLLFPLVAFVHFPQIHFHSFCSCMTAIFQQIT